ncbi:MAG TPA: orotate phosphoribosyltransferase [Candidatus Elarobacter sp.]|jgi:orotate phosphoribosyltransferase|nr:orotate phosphoribosyltransferase [Candidatus Elarobacter sp.]
MNATASDLLRELESRGAILSGHFRLSSGRHSNRFVQKFRILEDPVLVERVARALADGARAFAPTVVVSAAVGGIVLGYETARQLGTLGIFVEKENGVPALRRGFALGPDDRALVVEDVVTTGGSVREVIDVVRAHGAEPAAVGVVVQRAPADFGVPAFALLDLPIESFAPDACPQCAAGEPISEPGSRFLRS